MGVSTIERVIGAGRRVSALSFLCLCATLAADRANEISVIYSGETHAMLSPCECPDDPGGGLAERAAFINTLFPAGSAERRDALLLLDGGGFSGGGIYDTYSMGRAADSVRTLKTIAAMGMMGYDAAAIGDDDLQYGGEWLVNQAMQANLPLVCANCFTKDGKYLAEPYIIIRKGNNTFGITAVATTEKLFPVDTSVVIKSPLASLEKIRRELKRNSDYQILLSHLGEEEAGALLKKSPGFILAANGHRKVSVQPLVTVERTPTLFFGFQGKSLSYAALEWKNRSMRVARSGWHSVDGSAGSDKAVAAAISENQGQKANVNKTPDEEDRVYDLYIMSMCPYGIQALGELAELIRAFPQREWNVWFIGTAEGGALSSLRGAEEMFDEKMWLAVKALYPFRYHEFLFLKSSSQTPTEKLLEEMGLDAGKIRRWAETQGSGELRQHYIRSMRLNISASPTLLVNNSVYGKPLGGGRLVREECNAAVSAPDFCGGYPECFEDSDCRAKGKLGKCVTGDASKRAVCKYKNDVAFNLTVLIADTTMDNPEKQPIEKIEETLPGARVSVVKFSSDEGQKIMAKYAPTSLPFFHFENSAAKAYRFASIQEMLENCPTPDGKSDGFTFKKGFVRANFFPLRKEKPGAVELYADPLMPDIGKVIAALSIDHDVARRVVLKPLLLRDPRESGPSVQDKLRSEEALRWLVLSTEFPKKYRQYLSFYAADPVSSYWFNWLSRVGINRNGFLRRVEANKPKIGPYWERLSEVSSGEPVMIMINNRVKVHVPNGKELERLLKSIPAD